MLDAATYTTRFTEAMNDDFNTPQGLAVLFDLAREINQAGDKGIGTAPARETLKELGGVMGLTFNEPEAAPLDEELRERVNKLIEERTAARKEKNWQLADEIRRELNGLGIILEDTPTGTVWKRKR